MPQPQATPSSQIFVNVLGEVNRPARVVLPKGSGLLDAIASVDGLSRYANPSRITLIHKSTGERSDSTRIDLRPIIAGAAKDIVLRDGDTVVVGESRF